MNWYRFAAYNSQALYGFGSADEAEQFCDRLNKGRDINHYAATIVSSFAVVGLGLEEAPDSFNISDELQDAV
jgi:hypothetical protein